MGGIVDTGRVPSGSAERYPLGLVQVLRGRQVVAHQLVTQNHRYHFKLMTGRYKIVAHTKRGKCINHTQIRLRKTTHTNAYCVFH